MKINLSSQAPCCCGADPEKVVKKLTLPDGFQVGAVNLDRTLEEVAATKLAEVNVIKAELLKRFAKENYVPSCAEDEYATALFREYKRKYIETV